MSGEIGMSASAREKLDALLAPGGLVGKRVTAMGIGLLGRGVGDIGFFADRGADVLATDLKSAAALAPSIDALSSRPNVRLRLERHEVDDFANADLVLKPAGCPLDSPYIAAARAADVPVVMSGALFALLAPARIAGVTGTRGKSTITHWTHHALRRLGVDARLGGNVRGMSTLAGLDAASERQLHVLELDSWQLQGFDDLQISPSVSVFSNLMPDHMNYYRGDMDRYFWDKSAIYRWQRPGDTVVVGPGLDPRVAAAAPPAGRVDAAPIDIPPGAAALGPHGRLNAGLTLAALEALGADRSEARRAMAEWPGVEGRLYRLGALDGRAVYDDGNATTAEAAAAAISAFPDRRVAVICGGSDKKLSARALLNAIEARPDVAPVLLPGGGSDAMLEEASTSTRARFLPVADMSEAIAAALAATEPGDVVVLSPAFASFDFYRNEYDRSEAFHEAARAAGLREEADDRR